MADADPRSLQQIKRETEQTRAGLTNTVEQLKSSVAETASDIRHRISPDVIKAEVSDYIRSRGEQLMNDVTFAARLWQLGRASPIRCLRLRELYRFPC
jgi:hypothetical protein